MEQKLSFSQSLNSGIEPMQIYPASDLITGAKFIVTNGTEQSTDISMHWQCPVDILQRTFERIQTLINNSQDFFRDLTNAYANLFNIDLYLIAYNGNKFLIIDKERLGSDERDNHEHYAFLSCNAAKKVWSPVYELFKKHISVSCSNNTDQHSVEQGSVERDPDISDYISHMVFDPAFSSPNDINSRVRQPITTVNTRVSIKQMQEEIDQLIPLIISQSSEVGFGIQIPDFNSANLNQISPQEAVELIQQRLLYIMDIIQIGLNYTSQDSGASISSMIFDEENNQQLQMNETNHSVQTDQGSSNVSVHEPIDTSNSDQVSQSIPVSTSSEQPCEAPSIRIQPNSDWHYRSIKDLASNHAPCLAGEGPQRTPIQVKVPPEQDRDMYLAVLTLTYNNEKHDSKVIVPENTGVNMSNFCNDNNLSRLLFDKCKKQNNYCYPEDRCVYLRISPEEHEAQRKE
ncbi:unnamed protein product [Adineta steineri]|uniref:Uncharacterized protein n=1 Tax=Adineta steineri TaxID=433720 RepID=A0A814E5F8_9BILA|nr:unnamed protein product [Adineta steineri]CAF3753108.1 unnamed protein product [Adineta steineri]